MEAAAKLFTFKHKFSPVKVGSGRACVRVNRILFLFEAECGYRNKCLIKNLYEFNNSFNYKSNSIEKGKFLNFFRKLNKRLKIINSKTKNNFPCQHN